MNQDMRHLVTSERTAARLGAGLRLRRDGLVALLLFCAGLLIFNINLRTIGAADTYAARYLPLSIWKHGTLTLDPVALHVAQGSRPPQKPGQIGEAWWMLRTSEGHLVSMYPPVTPVLAAPLYLPAVLYLNATDWGVQRVERVGRIMEKLAASLIASISVVLMFLLLRRQTDLKTAAWLALLFGWGTSTWVISSQALWMHGIGQLLVIGLLWLSVLPRRTRSCAAMTGLLCALLACNRQPDAILAAGFAIHALLRDRGNFKFFVAGAVVPVAATLAYNTEVVGNWIGGYGLALQGQKLDISLLNTVKGVGGLLFSPVQGLFIFSPFLLFALPGFMRQFRQPSLRLLSLLLAGAAVLQVLFYAAVNWSSGVSWGPRFLTDLLPILFWMLPPVVEGLRGNARRVFVALSLFAVASSAIGAFGYTGSVHSEYLSAHPPENASQRVAISERAAWMAKHSPWLTRPTFFNDLFPGLSGSIDRLNISPEGLATVEGWAVFGSRQPFDVHLLIDGVRVSGGTSHFGYREDEHLGARNTGTWKISFPAALLTSGRPVFSALVRSNPQAMPWILQAFELPVPAAHGTPLAEAPWQGAIDAIRVHPNRGLDVVGWTSLGNKGPENLELWLDDRREVEIHSFFRRTDVEKALGVTTASGWRANIAVRGLSAGEHRISVVLPPKSPSSAPRRLVSKVFSVAPAAAPPPWSDEMATAEMAKFATWTLEHQQDSGGYWLTDYTSGVQFRQPHSELNVFSTAAIVDLLGPVSASLKLSGTLDKAKRFLSEQIEETGLVRYHGRPDLPSHGVLGCRITPDADDTALVWRLAPALDGKLQDKARATLEAFKTPEGLYRTWLAAQDRYECIDPGKNPNPADIGIQIHVLMWLYRVDPPAARKLCEVLQSHAQDPSLWVYYQRAPAAVMWRLPALRAMGCPLKLPESLLAVQDPDQQLWLKVIERIHLTEARPDRNRIKDNDKFLRTIAAKGFERVWESPLLYFHNDLTATVSRYYWSPELGLALWLRLFAANEQARRSVASSH
jgi:hypothetical protein